MAGRRLLLFVVLLITIGAVASATVPRGEDATFRRQRTAPPPPAPAQALPAATVVEAKLPGRDVRAKVGDIVQVRVTNDDADVVQVPALGLSEPVEPDLAAELVFDADRAGRFAVTLRDAQKRVGTIDVEEAG
jgi:FtsP/CotA-like multicopper oxidase with cupredoxin domain